MFYIRNNGNAMAMFTVYGSYEQVELLPGKEFKLGESVEPDALTYYKGLSRIKLILKHVADPKTITTTTTSTVSAPAASQVSATSKVVTNTQESVKPVNEKPAETSAPVVNTSASAPEGGDSKPFRNGETDGSAEAARKKSFMDRKSKAK